MPSSKKHPNSHPRSHYGKSRAPYARGNDVDREQRLKKRRGSNGMSDAVRNGTFNGPLYIRRNGMPMPRSHPKHSGNTRVPVHHYSKPRNGNVPAHRKFAEQEANKASADISVASSNGMSHKPPHPPHATHPARPTQHHPPMNVQPYHQQLHDGTGAAQPGDAMIYSAALPVPVPAVHHQQFSAPLHHHPVMATPADPKLAPQIPHAPNDMYYQRVHHHPIGMNPYPLPVDRARPVFFNMPPVPGVEYEHWVIMDIWGYGGWVKVPVGDPPMRRAYFFQAMGLSQTRVGEKVLYRVYYPHF